MQSAEQPMNHVAQQKNKPFKLYLSADATGQQSASLSAPQLTMIQQTPNRIAQQTHQMQSAGQPMDHVAQQLAMMTNAANMVSPQQIPIVEPQVDQSTKTAEVMREQFGLRSNTTICYVQDSLSFGL